jgi:uncharacterized protein YndB with AHSA1/START domain
VKPQAKQQSEPEHFKAWYGPDGVTVPVAKMDVRAGGSRLVCLEMNPPGGLRRMWFTGGYREVVQNQRLVYTESMSDESGNVLSPSDLGSPGNRQRPRSPSNSRTWAAAPRWC